MTKAIDIATKLIKLNEGCKLEVYTCPAGKPTFGYGTNLEAYPTLKAVSKEIIARIHDIDANYMCEQTAFKSCLAFIDNKDKQELANIFLEHEIINCKQALTAQKWFTDDLSDFQKAIILDLAYNIGVSGVLKFKNMIAAIEQRNYGLAFTEMLDSKYHYQMICYGYADELAAAEKDFVLEIDSQAQVLLWWCNLKEDYKKLRSTSNAASLQFDKPLGKYKELF